MATTLRIAVNYDTANRFFFFYLSYSDGATEWTSTLASGGTVQFVNDGEYRLTNNNRSRTFKFDAVEVVLGHTLTDFSSRQCGSTARFDLSSVVFPKLDGAASAAVPYSWCQAHPTSAGEKSLAFQDPKLGLSNTSGKEGIAIDASAWPRTCKC